MTNFRYWQNHFLQSKHSNLLSGKKSKNDCFILVFAYSIIDDACDGDANIVGQHCNDILQYWFKTSTERDDEVRLRGINRPLSNRVRTKELRRVWED